MGRALAGGEPRSSHLLDVPDQDCAPHDVLGRRQRDFEGEAALTLINAADTKPGLRLGGTWSPDDQWAFPAELELLSRETPTRALRAGIQADSYRLGARYRWSELRHASGNLQAMSFSDGNLRTNAYYTPIAMGITLQFPTMHEKTVTKLLEI